jgi:hypothetical protein
VELNLTGSGTPILNPYFLNKGDPMDKEVRNPRRGARPKTREDWARVVANNTIMVMREEALLEALQHEPGADPQEIIHKMWHLDAWKRKLKECLNNIKETL